AIAFRSNEGGRQSVWQVSATGGTPRALEQTQWSATLAWAPDSRIAYHEPGNRNIQPLDPVTRAHRPLVQDTSVRFMGEAHTSPDGRQVAVLWNRSTNPGLYVIPIQSPSKATLLVSVTHSFGTISQSVDASTFRGREVALVAHVKTNVSGADNQGQCWL